MNKIEHVLDCLLIPYGSEVDCALPHSFFNQDDYPEEFLLVKNDEFYKTGYYKRIPCTYRTLPLYVQTEPSKERQP